LRLSSILSEMISPDDIMVRGKKREGKKKGKDLPALTYDSILHYTSPTGRGRERRTKKKKKGREKRKASHRY